MIARDFRFHGYNALSHVYKHGRVLRGPLCMVRYEQNTKRSRGRLAVVVSKKVHKSAVTRNRIRRRIFEIVRHSHILNQSSIDMVITVHDERVASVPAEELHAMVNVQLQKIAKTLPQS